MLNVQSVANINEMLSAFRPITLEEMKAVKLMNRIDTKFVTTIPMLLRLLAMAGNDYRVQEISGERNMLYNTVYFDTPDCNMYCVHQHGHAGRQKLRTRNYVASNLKFLEVKTKNNRGRTKKKRIEIHDADIAQVNLESPANHPFLSSTLRYDTASLHPTMNNYFRRVTLVNNALTERLTIDTDLRFHNIDTGRDWHHPRLVIIELKRDGLIHSPVLSMLNRLHIRPHGFSKYCIGSALTNPGLPINRFKRKIIEINKILSAPQP